MGFQCNCGYFEGYELKKIESCRGCPKCGTTVVKKNKHPVYPEPHNFMTLPVMTKKNGIVMMKRCVNCGTKYDDYKETRGSEIRKQHIS